jgi:uncharacterized protein
MKTNSEFQTLTKVDKVDWRVAVTLVVTTLLISVEHYNTFFPEKWQDRFVIYLVIPFLLIKFLYRQPLAQFGVRLGNWRMGGLITLVSWAFLLLVMSFVARTPDFVGYYAGFQDEPVRLIIKNAFDLIGWEFIFRGWLVFTLLPICGPYAIIIQAIPFTIAHFGKPELETISCIFGGTLFGYIAWKTRSFLYPFLIHWFLTTITVLLTR